MSLIIKEEKSLFWHCRLIQQNRVLKLTCLMAVRKPCALKKPVIQKQLGRPSKHQEWNCVLRSINSVNQNPNVLESQEI
jgi:hypothetical protein